MMSGCIGGIAHDRLVGKQGEDAIDIPRALQGAIGGENIANMGGGWAFGCLRGHAARHFGNLCHQLLHVVLAEAEQECRQPAYPI
jgi:hypothetical protein